MTDIVVLIIGLPGSGKSTLALELSKKINAEILSTSSLIKNSEDIYQELLNNEYIKKGKKIDNKIYLKMIEKYIDKNPHRNYIIEGFPYDMEQLKTSEKLFKKLNLKIKMVIYIESDYDTLIKRIKNRSICPSCNTIYNRKNIICKKCNVKTVRRSDDLYNIARNRIEEQQLNIENIVNYYSKKNILLRISISDSEEEKIRLIESKMTFN